MKEYFTSQQDGNTKEDLKKDRDELMEKKRDYLDHIKTSVSEMFNSEQLPTELVKDMVEIRKKIRDDVAKQEYCEQLDENAQQKIYQLMFNMTHYGKESDNIKNITKDDDGNIVVAFEDGEIETLSSTSADVELVVSLENYFDAYKMAYNASRFRWNVKNAQQSMKDDNENRELSFYSKDEKRDVLVSRVLQKYNQAGFEENKIRELIDTCNLKDLDKLEIHQIKVISKIKDIFTKFVSGDKTKYVGLSTALLVPAFLEGYAPMFLANAFKGDRIAMTQVGLYMLISSVATGSSHLIEKHFKDFLDTNFQKEDGYAQHISESLVELPGEDIGSLGKGRVKSRIANGKYGYENILRTLSFDIFPAGVTLATSATMLWQKSPVLAGGTVAGAGIMMMIDKYVNKKGKFLEKERKAEEETEKIAQKTEELLNAHAEIIMSGQKDKFVDELESMFAQERISESDKRFFGTLRQKVMQMYSVLNFGIASVATAIAGGSPDAFVAALVYSNNFNNSMSRILESRRNLMSSLRDMMQLEIMFNGYAKEEKEREKDRIGVSELQSNDIKLTNASKELNGKKIFYNINTDIPSGQFVSLDGANGAGKTTFIKILCGYYKPTGGDVKIGGENIDDIKRTGDDSIYRSMVYLSQFPYILEDSIRNNLTLGVDDGVSDDEIREVLVEVGLDKRFTDLDEIMKSSRGDDGSTSGGQTTLIGLARILLKIRKSNPILAIFDEPTASVDEKMSKKIAEILNKEKKNNPQTTFILISHDKNFRESLATEMTVNLSEQML